MRGSEMTAQSAHVVSCALTRTSTWAGCRRPPGTRLPDWFAHARRALQGGPEASRYTYYIGPAAGAEEKLRVLTRRRIALCTWPSQMGDC